MKALAAIAILGLASASEDNELFKVHNNNHTKIDFPTIPRPHPIHPIHPPHHNKTHNATTIQPNNVGKLRRNVHPILFNRTHPVQNTNKTRHELPVKKPTIKRFDDEELFLADEIPENQLNKGVGKFVDRNKEWLAPVGNKLLDKLLSKWDDEELFAADLTDDELASFFGKVGSYVSKNKNVVVPVAAKLMGRFDDESNDSELHSTVASYPSGSKNVVTGVINKLIGRLDDESIDSDLYSNIASYPSGNKNAPSSGNKNVVGGVFNKLLGKLDDEFSEDELAFLGSVNRILQKNGPTVARVGVKALPILALDELNEDELFNLDAFLNDAVKTYNDARQQPRNYGNLVNDGIQIFKDIKQKKHDDELFNPSDKINSIPQLKNQKESIQNTILIKLIRLSELEDDELGFLKSLGNVAKKAGGFVVQHPQLVTKFLDDEQAQNELGFLKSLGNVAKKAGGFVVQHPQLVTKFLDDEDQEFFNLNTFLNDAIKTYNDAKAQPRNYGNLVNDGIQLVKDIKQKKQDDEVQNELGFLKSLGNVAKKAGGFVVQHPQVLAMLDDEEAENELGFLKSLGNVAKKAGGFVVQHPQLVTKFLDDEQMVLPKKVFDPKTIFKPTPTFPRPHPDLTFDDEELFSLKDNIHRAEQGAQVAKHYIYDRIEEIKESLKKHDDEELVNLGQLISEGLNTFGNAKKYEELVNDGLKTVQEVKPVSHVKKFMRH